MDRDVRFLGHRPEEFLGAVLIWMGGLLLLAAAGLMACQALYWLRWGEWPAVTGRDLLTYAELPLPQFEWAGIQKLATWTLTQPLAVIIAAVGTTVFCIGIFRVNE
jgi:hypothetical protein